MKSFLVLLLILVVYTNGYSLNDFKTCLAKTCGEIVCWKANNSQECNDLTVKYEACRKESENCQQYDKDFTAIANQESADMISYASCYSDCESIIKENDYLNYYYKCYSDCSDSNYSILISFSIGMALLSLFIL